MTRALCLAAVVAATTVALADDAKELKSLDGTYMTEKVTIKGGDQSEGFKDVKLVIADGKYTVTAFGTEDKGTVTVDAGKTPKAMDIEGTDGPNKGKKYPAIYEFKDGTLTICYGLDEKTRPTKFESTKETDTMLVVYKRK
jgi:uncharacterized protein (TIGR03067 family)